jgi:hypothetical protein
MTDIDDLATKEVYVGDGLFASYYGFSLWLRAPREGGSDHFVALEPLAFEVLLEYAKKCGVWKPKKEARHAA